jgi:hypothetical protein
LPHPPFGEDFREISLNNNITLLLMRKIVDTKIKEALKDVYLYIGWGKFSNTYFGKSASWIYNKFNGTDGNGGEGGFTDKEKEQLKCALFDFSEKIRRIAENL